MIAASVCFALLITVVWNKCIVPPSTKGRRRNTRYEREEFKIDPATVPEFKPTWANSRSISADGTARDAQR